MPKFAILLGIDMAALWTDLTRKKDEGRASADEAKLLKQWSKAAALLEENPRHPGLHTHEIDELSRRFGEKVWQSYLENRTPGAARLYWVYGPERHQITLVGLDRHPESGKRAGYAKVTLSGVERPRTGKRGGAVRQPNK